MALRAFDGYCYASETALSDALGGKVLRVGNGDAVVDWVEYRSATDDFKIWYQILGGAYSGTVVGLPVCTAQGVYGVPEFSIQQLDSGSLGGAFAAGLTVAIIPLALIWAVRSVLSMLR